MPPYAGYINNEFTAGRGEQLAVENPSDESELASFPGLSLAQTEDAIVAARRAFDRGNWSERPAHERAVVLRRFADALARRASEIIDLTVAEAGCPRNAPVMNSQVHVPLRHACELIEFFLTLPEVEDNPLPLSDRITPSGQTVQSLRRYTPIGVVAAIPAYNFPFFTALWKLMPALLTGNTVILRPSPLTPLSAMIFADAAKASELPPGILNIVLESGLDGARLLTTHSAVDMVGFTGSTAVGVQVMTQAAATMKRLQLELGGKSAQIFLPDAVERAAAAAVSVCTAHAGQGCSLGTRVFVPEARKSEVLEQMTALCRRIRVGPAYQADTQMGPVISAAQRTRCEHFVKLAVENGGRIVTGGKRPAHLHKGYYFEPTVLDVPDNSNPAAQEEIFGPVVCVIGYRDINHAIAMANDSRYGLSGYVWGADRALALKVGMRVRSGTVHVNTGITSAHVSMGGHRASGIGRERGVEGLRQYQQLSCLNLGG
jgi:aldehyde dehydrogenase (NAD+)